MKKLPTNPTILLCIINTKLRDFYSSLNLLCDDLDEDKDEIISILNNFGYVYDRVINQFIKKD